MENDMETPRKILTYNPKRTVYFHRRDIISSILMMFPIMSQNMLKTHTNFTSSEGTLQQIVQFY